MVSQDMGLFVPIGDLKLFLDNLEISVSFKEDFPFFFFFFHSEENCRVLELEGASETISFSPPPLVSS